MIILVIIGILFVIAFIQVVYTDLKDSARIIKEKEEIERSRICETMEREYEAERQYKKAIGELQKQLNAVQYQIQLLEKLDNFRPDTLLTEKDVKKALTLEKQYNALWTKERKLKEKINTLKELRDA